MNRMPLFPRSSVVIQPGVAALLLGSISLAGCGDQKDPTQQLDTTSDESSETSESKSSEPAPINPGTMPVTPGASSNDTDGSDTSTSGPNVDTSDEPTGGATSSDTGTTSPDPTTTEPPNGDELCPIKDGATWTYYHTSNGGWTKTLTTTVADYDGASTFVISDTPHPKNDLRADAYHVKEGGRLLRIYKEEYWVNPSNGQEVLDSSATYGVGFLRCDEAWASKEVGFSESPGYFRIETVAGQAPKAGADRKHTFTVEAREDVTTSGGLAFTNCVKVRRGKDWAATTGEEIEEKLYWFCPGVGKVREENVESGNTEELTEYDVPE